MDVLRIALADEEGDGRGVGRGIVGELFLPAGIDEARALDGGDVPAERQRHHVGVEAVDDRARLLARAAMRLLERDIVSGLRLVFGREKLVVLGVELARRVVRDIEQANVSRDGRRSGAESAGKSKAGQSKGGAERPYFPLHHSFAFRQFRTSPRGRASARTRKLFYFYKKSQLLRWPAIAEGRRLDPGVARGGKGGPSI